MSRREMYAIWMRAHSLMNNARSPSSYQYWKRTEDRFYRCLKTYWGDA